MKKVHILAAVLAVVLLLTGCNMPTASQLYRIPQRSEEFTNLQSVMQKAMNGSEYSAPQGGDHQQTLQAADLDGDGEVEYLLFAKSNSGEKPLRIYIFSGAGESYRLQDTIECNGTAFDQVDYLHIKPGGGVELIVGHQVSDQVVRTLSVYSMVDGQMERILATGYSRFLSCDLNRNGLGELLVIHPDSGNRANGVVELYSVESGTVERSQEVFLSSPADKIKRVVHGILNNGPLAVYVASELDSGAIITDVYALINGQLTNVSLSAESGTSIQTIRNYYVYADDIDSDGVLELPSLITLGTGNNHTGDSNQYVIRWFALDSSGAAVDKMYTYHNFVGGWYLRLNEELAKQTIVSQRGNSCEFNIWNAATQQPDKIMTLYTLTGQKREEQAVEDNRFVVYRTESTVYAVKLEVASAAYGITQEDVLNSFHMIVQEWKNGLT